MAGDAALGAPPVAKGDIDGLRAAQRVHDGEDGVPGDYGTRAEGATWRAQADDCWTDLLCDGGDGRLELVEKHEPTAAAAELAGALRLLAGWGARHAEGGGALRHEVCGTPLEARLWCPSCEAPVDLGDASDIDYA